MEPSRQYVDVLSPNFLSIPRLFCRSPRGKKKRQNADGDGGDGPGTTSRNSHPGDDSRPGSPDRFVPLYDKDLIRMMAEVNFINGEVRVGLLTANRVVRRLLISIDCKSTIKLSGFDSLVEV